MKTLGIIMAFASAMGFGLAVVPSPSPAPPALSANPPALTVMQPLQAAFTPSPPIPLVPTVPEFKAFGQIHVNGKVAFEQGPATGTITIGGVPCCKQRMWRTDGPGIPIEVHRVLADDGSAVYWWAVLLDARWQPKYLSGTDYNCSGGGFNVTP